MFDFLVVGAGLMGSAAGYHLARQAANVAIVGPAEPADWANHDGVFSSHYDQGRLASYYGSDTIWNRLDQAAIANYRTIEAASGIRFYEAVGMISLVPAGKAATPTRKG